MGYRAKAVVRYVTHFGLLVSAGLLLAGAAAAWANLAVAQNVSAAVALPAPSLEQVPIRSLPQFSLPPITVAQETTATTTKAPKSAAKYDVARIGERGIGGGVNLYSLEKERMLGQELSHDVEQDAYLVTDPVITEYVNRIGQGIVRNSDARVPFTIKVIDSDEVNAFALPGGYFYVNTGLILAADNEAELAGVMAHEIAHVAARHATRNATRAEIWNLVSIPLIFAGGPAGYAIREAAGILVPMSFLKFSRNAEREADLLGLEYEYAAGYDPEAFVEFFEKLQVRDKKQHHSFVAKAFSTHPMTEDRVKAAQKDIAKYLPAREEYVVTTSDFEQVRARVLALSNRHQIDEGRVRPTLRPRNDSSQKPADDSHRPTLKRPDPQNN